MLGSGSYDRTVSVCTVSDLKTVKTLTQHRIDVIAVSFSVDGGWFACGRADISVVVYK
jgi:WD40 repeat protein